MCACGAHLLQIQKKPRRCRTFIFILFKGAFLADFVLSVQLASYHFSVNYFAACQLLLNPQHARVDSWSRRST
ncbi:hypothetical protein QG78_000939 [Salmonella enterica subsp. enterica]|nr:hypothetical protein [Salmonella enterica subsp. enterica serovar Bredeney]EEJ8781813.1 hypothetical protein [Salmonella enterica subsp. enterica]